MTGCTQNKLWMVCQACVLVVSRTVFTLPDAKQPGVAFCMTTSSTIDELSYTQKHITAVSVIRIQKISMLTDPDVLCV